MENVEIIPFHPCWEWVGRKNQQGYGVMSAHNGEVGAYRVSYELHKGVIPRGNVILHSCDNRTCVRPEHLSAGTQSQNMRDMVRKGRGRNKYGQMKNVFKRFEDVCSVPAGPSMNEVLKINSVPTLRRSRVTIG